MRLMFCQEKSLESIYKSRIFIVIILLLLSRLSQIFFKYSVDFLLVVRILLGFRKHSFDIRYLHVRALDRRAGRSPAKEGCGGRILVLCTRERRRWLSVGREPSSESGGVWWLVYVALQHREKRSILRNCALSHIALLCLERFVSEHVFV